MYADKAESSKSLPLALSLAVGLVFLTIIGITIAVSIVVYSKVRKRTFRMQRNKAYHGVTVTKNQDVVVKFLEQSAVYVYPMADNDKGERSNTAIVTERNEAYGIKGYDNPLRNLELTYAEIDAVVGGAEASNLRSLGQQIQATPPASEDRRQASLECNKACDINKSDNAYYESISDSATTEKYDYVKN